VSVAPLPGHESHACCGACEYASEVERGERIADPRDGRAIIFAPSADGVPRDAAVSISGRLHPVTKAKMSFGRAPDNDLVVPDKKVSRRVGFLTFDEQGVTIEDSGSACGIYIAGQKVNRARFRVGDRVMLVDQILEVIRSIDAQRPV